LVADMLALLVAKRTSLKITPFAGMLSDPVIADAPVQAPPSP
jgi:hypothetical protein